MANNQLNVMYKKYSDIVGHILKEDHSYLKEILPELERFTFTIFRVHYNDSGDVLERVYKLFSHLKGELNSHIVKEERALFFMIKDYEKEPSKELLEDINKMIQLVEKDNEKIESLLEEIKEATNGYTLPASSCATYELTYDHLKKLEEETHKHLSLEKKLFQRLKEEIK